MEHEHGAMHAGDVDVGNLELEQALHQVYEHVHGLARIMCIRCAVELGIPDAIDRLGGGPVALPDLAAALPNVSPDRLSFLARLLRLMAHQGFLAAADGDGGYVLTPFSRLLMKSNPRGMFGYFKMSNQPFLYHSWLRLGEWFGGDSPSAWYAANGNEVWDFFRENPGESGEYNEAMHSNTRVVMELVVWKCSDVFRGVGSLVDVGGGTGVAALAIAKAFPAVRCSVLDLPHVVATVEGGRMDGVDFIAGDMFQYIPPADVIFLKSILHGWIDEDCVKILKRCKDSLPKNGGKLVVIDVVLNSKNSANSKRMEAQHLLDATLMLACIGKERDEGEWRAIFAEAGFTRFQVKCDVGIDSLMEVYP